MNELQKQTLLAEIDNYSDFDRSLLTDEMMTNYFNTVDKLGQAQKAIDWFIKFTGKLSNYGLYEMHDLKLHDLSFHISDNKELYGKYDCDLFNMFCEESYDQYEWDLKELFGKYKYHKHSDYVDYIGHTSKFVFKRFDIVDYLNSFIDYNINSGLYDYDVLVVDDKSHYSSNELPTDIDYGLITPIDLYLALTDSNMDRYGHDENDVIDDFNDYLKEVNEDLDNIINNLLLDYKHEIKDTLTVFNHIRNFKKNQVENFKYWFDNQKEWLDENCLKDNQ